MVQIHINATENNSVSNYRKNEVVNLNRAMSNPQNYYPKPPPYSTYIGQTNSVEPTDSRNLKFGSESTDDFLEKHASNV